MLANQRGLSLAACYLPLFANLTMGCHRPIDPGEHRSPPDNAERTAAHVPTSAASGPQILTREMDQHKPPSCLRRIAKDLDARGRLQQVVARCGAGLVEKQPPIGWHLDNRTPIKVVALTYAEPACVRFVISVDPPGQRAEAVIVDGTDRELARVAGSDALTLPIHGPLCVPENSSIALLVASDDGSSLSGYMTVLSSP